MSICNVERVLHLRVHVDWADVRAYHVHIVEVCVRSILQKPCPSGIEPYLSHWYRFAWPIHDLGAVKSKRTQSLRVLAIRAADRAQVANVIGTKDRIEGVDAITKQFDPSVVNIVRSTRAFAAPQVVLRDPVDDLARRRDDEENIEVPVFDYLGPTRLALHKNVRRISASKGGQAVRLWSGNVDKQLARGRNVWDIEDLIREPGESPFREGNQLHRHVYADDRNSRMDAVFDDVEIPIDVLPRADAVHDRGETNCHVRRNRISVTCHSNCHPDPPRARLRLRHRL